MSTAIFLTPRCDDGGYDIEVGEDHARLADGQARLVLIDKYGGAAAATLGEGDWEQLRDRIDQMLHTNR